MSGCSAGDAIAKLQDLPKRPVAWRIRDGSGWVYTEDEEDAYRTHERSGAEIQGLYVRDGT